MGWGKGRGGGAERYGGNGKYDVRCTYDTDR